MKSYLENLQSSCIAIQQALLLLRAVLVSDDAVSGPRAIKSVDLTQLKNLLKLNMEVTALMLSEGRTSEVGLLFSNYSWSKKNVRGNIVTGLCQLFKIRTFHFQRQQLKIKKKRRKM